MNRGSVIVFAKTPKAGRVKTRLGADIGMGARGGLVPNHGGEDDYNGAWAAIGKPFLQWTRQRLWRRAMRHGRMTCAASRKGPGILVRVCARVFALAPPAPTMIIGADAPSLKKRHIKKAFEVLRAR